MGFLFYRRHYSMRFSKNLLSFLKQGLSWEEWLWYTENSPAFPAMPRRYALPRDAASSCLPRNAASSCLPLEDLREAKSCRGQVFAAEEARRERCPSGPGRLLLPLRGNSPSAHTGADEVEVAAFERTWRRRQGRHLIRLAPRGRSGRSTFPSRGRQERGKARAGKPKRERPPSRGRRKLC